MFSLQSINIESESSDNIFTSTSTPKSVTQHKTYIFAENTSSVSMFTYTKTDKTAEKSVKTNIKKQKITETSRKTAQSVEQTETSVTDTEEKKKDPAVLYNTARKTL